MKIALIGYGKMGKAIEQIALAKGHEIVLKIDVDNAKDFNETNLQKADVAIEFTGPHSAYANVTKCLELGIPVVCGSTGWLDKWEDVKNSCLEKNGTLIYASNYSIGVNLFFELNTHLAKLMAPYQDYLVSLEEKLHKIYWPSSIAVFGPTSPKLNCPQHTIIEPSTVYGISKYAGEFWCNYYFHRYGVDVRSIRYPGLISYKSEPGGGTTDYAVEIYHEALSNKKFKCFLEADTYLPMMYMPDAIRATLELMEAPKEHIKIRTAYNISGMSFSPKEITAEIAKHIEGFQTHYEPDYRQAIANSWPQSIDDSVANQDWGWKAEFDLAKMTKDMLENLR